MAKIKFKTIICLFNAIHCMGQNIKSLAACVCVCARTKFEAEYLENGKR